MEFCIHLCIRRFPAKMTWLQVVCFNSVCVFSWPSLYYLISNRVISQQTQNICITFVQSWTNVCTYVQMIYKCVVFAGLMLICEAKWPTDTTTAEIVQEGTQIDILQDQKHYIHKTAFEIPTSTAYSIWLPGFKWPGRKWIQSKTNQSDVYALLALYALFNLIIAAQWIYSSNWANIGLLLVPYILKIIVIIFCEIIAQALLNPYSAGIDFSRQNLTSVDAL